MPKVTVIIPNYNHAFYLNKRIESVLKQTYQDFDLIIMDDCSTDNSREIIDSYALKDKRIKTIYNDKNSGSTFKQWNRGVDQAAGEYIWIAESDDYADERFLEVMVKGLGDSPTAGIIYCQSWIINEKDEIINSADKMYAYISHSHWQQDYYNTGIDECKNFLVIQNTIPNTSALLVRKEIYIKAGMANEAMRFLGDWLQWLKILLLSDIIFVAKPLNFFRQHTSTTRISASSAHKGLNEYYQVLQFISKHRDIYSVESKMFSLQKRWQSVCKKPLTFKGLVNLIKTYPVAKPVDSFYLLRVCHYLIMRLIYYPKAILKKLLKSNKTSYRTYVKM